MRTLEQVEANIAATEAQLARLHAERNDISEAARMVFLREKLATFPAEVREMLKANYPPLAGIKRLVPRGLARKSYQYTYAWTDFGQELRALLVEETTAAAG